MSVLVATSTHRSRFGTSRLWVYAPALPSGLAAPVALASTAPPEVPVGSISPAFAALVRPTTLTWSLLDPTGLLADLRDAHEAEPAVYADVEVPAGLAAAGLPLSGRLRWRFSVTDAGPLNRQPSAVAAERPVTVRGRCGLDRLGDADGPPTSQATLAGYARALLDAADLGGYPLRVDVPVWPADATGAPLAVTDDGGEFRDPRLVRFAVIADEDDPAADDAFGGLEGTGAGEAADALCLAFTSTLSLDPRPEAWALVPGGDPDGDWGTERVPTVALTARSRPLCPAGAAPALVEPVAWGEGVGRDTAPAPPTVALGAGGTFEEDGDAGDLDPLRTVTMKTGGVDVSVTFDTDEGETAEAPVGKFRPTDSAGLDVELTGTGLDRARVGLRLDRPGQPALYLTEDGGDYTWTTTPGHVLLTDGAVFAPISGTSGYAEGDVYAIAEGDSDGLPFVVRVRYVDATTGDPVLSIALTVSAGFRGRAVEVPSLHRLEYYDGDSWEPVPRWRSDAAAETGAGSPVNGAFPSAPYAQAYERAAQEAPPGPVPAFVAVDGLLSPADTVDLDGVGPCHVVGVTLAPADGAGGGCSVQLATVLPGGAAP